MSETAGRVLIADADEALRQRIYSRLLDLNLFADTALSATQAVELVAARLYAVVIIDVEMPGIDKLLDEIRKIEVAKRPLVLVTTREIPSRGAFDTEVVQIVLRKPFNVTHLCELVSNCVRRAAQKMAASGEDAPPPPPVSPTPQPD